jgi:flavin-binding protein dodecin
MSVAKVVEISATSPDSFEDAVRQGIAKASETLRNIRSVWIKEQGATVSDGAVTEFQVNLQVTFVLE